MTKKQLTTFLRLLSLYKIDKIHKEFLSNIKARSVNEWYETWNRLIDRYTEDEQKKFIENYKKHCSKSEQAQMVKAYKKNKKNYGFYVSYI